MQPTVEEGSSSLKVHKISSTSEDAGYIWDERQAHHSIAGGVPIIMRRA